MRLIRIMPVLLASVSSAAVAEEAPPALNPGEMLLQVQAEGESRNRPDVMEITAGITTSGQSAAQALAANNDKAANMLKAVRELGIAPQDVRTSELSVRPVLSDDDGNDRKMRPPVILGFVATNNVEIRLRDLARAGGVISSLFAAGANSVRGPVFSLSNPKPAERQARFDAVAKAREEAETYAQAFGMRIGRVIRSSERGDFQRERYNDIVITGSRIRPTPIEPGELKTDIQLWVDYALVPK